MNHRARQLCAGVLGSLLLLTACGTSAVESNDDDATAAYSDREIVEAVVFGTGPAAHLRGHSLEQQLPDREYLVASRLARQIIDALEAQDEDLVAGVAHGVTSGDPYSVTAALDDLSEPLYHAAAVVVGEDELDAAISALATNTGYGACSLFAVCAVWVFAGVLNVAVATNAAAAAAVAAGAVDVAVAVHRYMWTAHPETPSLDHDVVIAELTRSFDLR